jgi:hypothetical protein
MKSTATAKKLHSAPKTNHKAPHKGGKAEAKAERPEKMADVKAAEPLKPEKDGAKPGRAARTRKGAAAVATLPDDQPKTRLALIKSRHEAMKREIDQIREDLESDEDE